jgi:hypothetical protein
VDLNKWDGITDLSLVEWGLVEDLVEWDLVELTKCIV